MIFKTYEQFDEDKNVTDGLHFFWEANEKQKKFDEELFHKDLNKQTEAVTQYCLAYDRAYDAADKSLSAFERNAEATSKARQEIEWASDATKAYCVDTDRAAISTDEFAKKQTAHFEAQQKSQKGLKGLSSSMKAMGANLGADLLAGLAINGIFSLASAVNGHFKITADKKLEAMETAVNDYNDAISKSEDGIDTIKSLETEFSVLAKGVDSSGKNIGLSADEFERYNQIVSELVGLNPSLLQGYTAEGNAIVDRNSAIQDGIKLQQEYAQKATQTYASNDSGNDIINGANVNVREATNNMRKEAKNMAKNFEDYYAASGVGKDAVGPTAVSKDLNEILGTNLDLEKASAEQLKHIADRREEILKKAKESGNYSEQELTNLDSSLIALDNYAADLETATQPIYEWLSAAAGQSAGDITKTFGDELPAGMREAYESGLKQIASTGTDAASMKSAANDLSKTLSDMYAKNTGNYKNILDEAKKAEENFMQSDRLKADAAEYNGVLLEKANALDALADKYAETDAAASAAFQSQADTMRNFVDENKLSLENAVHAFDEYITEARTAKEKYDAAMSGGDYYTATDGLKEVYDTIADEKNSAGNGSLGFWQGAEQILGTDALREAEYDIDKVKSKLNELKPALEGGEEGSAALFAKLSEEANGTGKIVDEFGDKIATVTESADGMVEFDIPEENYAAVARQLGVSVDMLTAMIDNARQFANVDFHNINDVMSALKDSDSSINRNGKTFADRNSLEQETNLHGKQLDNLIKEMEGKGAQILDTSSSVGELKNQLIGLGDATKGADGLTKVNLANTLDDFKQMNMSLEDVEYNIDKLKHDDAVEIDGNADKISEMYSALDKADEIDDPFAGVTSSLERLTSALDTLTIAMGGMPEFQIDDNLDEISQNVRKFQNEVSSMDNAEKKDFTKEAETAISGYEEYIEDYKKKLQNSNLSDDEKLEIQADISDAEEKLTTLRSVIDDLQDGKLDNFTFNAETGDFEKKVEEVSDDIEGMDGKEAKPKVEPEVNGAEAIKSTKKDLDDINGKTCTAIIDAQIDGETNLETFLDQFNLSDETKNIVIDTVMSHESGDIESYEAALESLPSNVRTVVEAIVGDSIGQLELVDGKLTLLNGKTATAKADMQDNASGKAEKAKKKVEELDKAKANPTANLRDNASGSLNSINSKLNDINGKNVSASVSVAVAGVSAAANALSLMNKLMSLGKAEGTPNRRKGKASIHSMAKGGRVGPNGNGGPTLTGELGPELVWLPSESRSFIVGALGPEVVHLPKDAVVYPADETKRILAGEDERETFGSMAKPSATGKGSKIVKKKKKSTTKNTSGRSNNNSGRNNSGNNNTDTKSDKTQKNAKKTKEIYDWIEVKLDRIQRIVDNWNKKAEQTHRFYGKRLGFYDKEYAKIKREISLQEKGQARYNKQAKKVKLSKKWKKLVDNGKIDINSVKDDKLKEKIKNYKEWREKALDCRDAIIDLKGQLAEIQKEKFDTIVVKFEGKLAKHEFDANMVDEKVSQAENKGRIVSTNYYSKLKGIENQNIATLQNERAELQKQFNAAMKTGAIKKNSEMWYEMRNEINDVTLAIEESRTKLTEYDKTMREIRYDIFDRLQDRISKVTKEAEFFIDLMSNKKLYDDKGQLTDQGLSTMGMHGMNYNVDMAQADKYAQELKKVQAELNADPYNEDIRTRRDDLLEKQWESILAAEKEKDAIVDMVEEGINLELDSLDELIDKYKDALDSQKDLYDYQKKVTEQTEDIASLRKQLSAYANDDSEESKQKIQQIKASLEKAEEDLKDTEYDHYIDAQKDLLDDLYSQYEETLNARLDNIDLLMKDMITKINENASTIATTLNAEATNVGTKLTNEMSSIWSDAGTKISEYKDAFVTNNTTVNNTLSKISVDVASMVSALNAQVSGGGGSADSVKSALSSLGKPLSKSDSSTGKTKTMKMTMPAKKSDKALQTAHRKVHSFFVYKAYDPYKKKDLKKDTTLLGKLRYNDFATDDQSLAKYYKGMGFTDTFKNGGTKAQRKKMLNWMKEHGYKRGSHSIPEDQLAWTNENTPETIIRKSDGAILTPLKAGDMVLNTAAHENIWDMAADPTKFISDHFMGTVPAATTVNNSSEMNYNGDCNVNINLPNVESYDQFVHKMQRDRNFEGMMQSMTVGQSSNGNSVRKFKY